MKKNGLIFLLLLLVPPPAVYAQFVVETEGLFVAAGSDISLDGLDLQPNVDFTISSNSLVVSSVPIPGSPPGIERVFVFSQPVEFAGLVGFAFQLSELNGNEESSLQIAYGDDVFTTTVGSSVDEGLHYISNQLEDPTTFRSITAAQPGALPIRLAGFEASRAERQILLTWHTASEQDSDFFEIQHSADARQWGVLGSVPAAVESRDLQSYRFLDPAFRPGYQYYRLRMVDRDGTYTFSPIRSVVSLSAEVVHAYPNPVSDMLYPAADSEVAVVQLLDLSGRVLLRVAKPVEGQSLDMRGFAAGIYALRFDLTDGESRVVRIVKQ